MDTRPDTISSLVAFALLGLFNTAIGYVVFLIVSATGMGTATVLAVSYAFGIVFNYMTTGRMLFASRGLSSFIVFVTIYLVAYAANLEGIALLSGYGLDYRLGQAIMAVPIALLTFVGFRMFLGPKRSR